MKNKNPLLIGFVFACFCTAIGEIVNYLLDPIWNTGLSVHKPLWNYVWMFFTYYGLFYYFSTKADKKNKKKK